MADIKQNKPISTPLPRPRPVTGDASAMTAKDVYVILRRHVLLITIMTFLGLIAGGVSWKLLAKYSPKYTAQTYIRVLDAVEKDPMKIGSTNVNKEVQYGYRLSMANLLTSQARLEELVTRDNIKKTEWFQGFGDIQDVRIQKAIKNLEDNFRASPQRDGEFIIVSMTCGDKKEAALIVNEMVDLFLASQGASKRSEVGEQLQNLQSRLVRVEGELDASERAMDEIRARWNITDIEERDFRNTIETKLDTLEVDSQDLAVDIEQITANIETLKRQAEGPINEQVENQIESDPTMIFLTQQVASLEAQLAGTLTKFGENHRVVRQVRELLNETRARKEFRKVEISEQTRQSNLKNAQDQLVIMQARLEGLEKLREEANARKRDLDLARIQFSKAISIRDERREVRDSLKEQIEKMRIVQQSPDTPKLKKEGVALEPREVSFPKWQVFFPAGTMLGMMLGLGLAFLIEMANDIVRTPRDVIRYLHTPLMGVIPDAEEDKQLKNINLEQVVRQAPYSIISESYRRFRTNIKLSENSASAKVILVTSGMAGDGKTPVAANLAATFVAEGKKVLLIDANFWRPLLGQVFAGPVADPPGSPDGLSTLLTNQSESDQVITQTSVDDLHVVHSGVLPDNPAELLGCDQMGEFLEMQKAIYDYVIIDGPPVLLVSDTKMLARHADGTVLVFNAETTKRGAALRTIRELKEVHANVLGCVLFAVKALKGGYFNEQYKNYQKYQSVAKAG